jgi:hypothetical protein
MFPQEPPRSFIIATEIKHGRDRSRHDFCIADLALLIFGMVKCFQQIVAKAENCYNLAVHVRLRFRCGLDTDNFTRCYMDFLAT